MYFVLEVSTSVDSAVDWYSLALGGVGSGPAYKGNLNLKNCQNMTLANFTEDLGFYL